MFRTAFHQATRTTSFSSPHLSRSLPSRSAARTFIVSTRYLSPKPPSSSAPGQSDGTPSPAERPPSVPDSISKPPTNVDGSAFEPIVNDLSSMEGPHTVSSSSALPESTNEGASETIDLSSLPSLDIDPTASLPPPPSESEAKTSSRTGARSKPSLSSSERRRRNMFRLGMGAIIVAGIGGTLYLANEQDAGAAKEGNAYERFKKNLADTMDYFNKPAFEKLLPDPLPAPHQRPYTLLIDLDGFLVHSSWDRAFGWRTAKRPGVDYFLAYLSQFYEVVLFTTQPSYTAMGVAEKLDPFQAYLPYKLYRESTRYVNGKIVKDLSYLNRDLSKVILIDTNPEHVAMQPENAIIVKPWDGKPGDKGLVDLIPFLESIGIFAPPDVRPILKAYQGKDIPVEYAKREAERKQAAIEEWERDHGSSAASTGGAGWLSQMFGSLGGNTVPRQTQPMTYLEAKRAQAQKMYQEEQEYWAKNADEIRRLMEEDRQKQLAEQKGSLMGWMAGPKPEQANK